MALLRKGFFLGEGGGGRRGRWGGREIGKSNFKPVLVHLVTSACLSLSGQRYLLLSRYNKRGDKILFEE